MVVSYFQNGVAPSMPTNLRVQSNRTVTVDAMRMNLERRCHSPVLPRRPSKPGTNWKKKLEAGGIEGEIVGGQDE